MPSSAFLCISSPPAAMRLSNRAIQGIPHNLNPFPLPDTLLLQSDALHHSSCRCIPGSSDTDNALQMVLPKAKTQGSQARLRRQALTPPGAVQFPADLNLVCIGPVVQFVQAHPANPLLRRLIEGSPGTKPVAPPLLE